MNQEEAERVVLDALALAMARDGSSGVPLKRWLDSPAVRPAAVEASLWLSEPHLISRAGWVEHLVLSHSRLLTHLGCRGLTKHLSHT